jgi:diaminopimelate epimerase
VIDTKTVFNAVDGLHHASINNDGIVSLQMIDVTEINIQPNYTFLNTGSHIIELVTDLRNYNVKDKGAAIRYGALYGKAGSNINFVRANR